MSALETQPTVSELFPAFAEGFGVASHDPRALRILAKTIYRELRQSGLAEQDVMAVAGELLSLVASEVKARRTTRDAG
ncbi:MAG: hypothetical protein ACMG6S_19085 [Byssovorax sp.]